MPRPSYAELRDMHHAAETERVRLAATLKTTQAALWRERTIRRLPRLAPVISLVTGETEEAYSANADALDAALEAARKR